MRRLARLAARSSTTIFVASLAFAGMAAAIIACVAPLGAPSPLIGHPAPAFALPRLHDPKQMLASSEYLGRVWVLNVWASWCTPCRDEHPMLLDAAREVPIPFVGLNYKDDPRDAQEWLMRLGDPYSATAIDREGRAGTDWGVQGVPATFVIDHMGRVRFTHAGPLTREVWAREVVPLLAQLRQ